MQLATDSVAGITLLDDLHGCAGLSIAPDASRIAVTCSGGFGGTSTPTTSDAGVVVLAIDEVPGDQQPPTLSELGRWSAAELGGRPLGLTADFVGRERLLLTTLGQFGESGQPDVGDSVLELELVTSEQRTLLSTTLPFELGEVRCTAPCGHCYVADGESSVVAQLSAGADGWLAVDQSIVVDTAIGLPPRGLGRF